MRNQFWWLMIALLGRRCRVCGQQIPSKIIDDFGRMGYLTRHDPCVCCEVCSKANALL